MRDRRARHRRDVRAADHDHVRDPLSGTAILGRLGVDGGGVWDPKSAIVVAGVLGRHTDACSGCCPVLNFFASADNARRWLDLHPDIHGQTISMSDAIAAGRAVFGDVLRLE